MDVLVVCKMSDYKLKTTLSPLSSLEPVEKIYLVRRNPIVLPKAICVCPPRIIRFSAVLSDIYRFFSVIYLMLFAKVDIIIGIYFYFHCIIAAIGGIIFRKSYIFSIIEEPVLYRKNWFFKMLARKSKAILVRGEKSKIYLKQLLKSNNIFVLPDYFEFNDRNLKNNEKSKYDFVFVGGLVKDKRVDVLVDVISEVKKEYKEVKLAIIGEGEMLSAIKWKMSQNNLGENIDLLGFVEDIYGVLRQSKVFIMTSETEGLPTVLIEAINCGLPIIAPDVGDISDIAFNNYNALLYERLNIKECASCCLRVIKDQDLYSGLAKNTLELRKKKAAEYSLRNVASVWEEALG